MAEKKKARRSLLETLYHLENKIGERGLINALNTIGEAAASDENFRIIEEVCLSVGIKPELLPNKKYSKNENRTEAVMYICAILHLYKGMSGLEIGNIIGFEESPVYRIIKNFKSLNKNNSFDSGRLERYNKIIEKLNDKKLI